MVTLRSLHGRAATAVAAFAAVAAVAALAGSPRASAAQATGFRAPPAAGFAAIVGTVDDSLRGGSLAGATVSVVGTPRVATTDQGGLFRIDSIPPGEVRLMVRHALLDSLLITVSTAPFVVAAGGLVELALGTPTLSRVREQICPRGGVRAGDAMLAGRVDHADTRAPVANVLVSLVYSDPASGSANERVRNARTDADGLYAICGLPETYEGRVQAAAGANTSADIPVSTSGRLLATASFLLGSATKSDSGTIGAAELKGRITDVAGRPVEGAQVAVEGGNAIAVTAADGSFTLRRLPSGTTIASVRKIGFAPATRPVHLRETEPQSLEIALAAGTRTLATVTVTAKADQALDRLGFNERLRMGSRANFMSPDEIDRRQANKLTDIFRTMPGFVVSISGNNQTVQSSRAVSGGQTSCVNIFVDRIAFEQMSPGDLDGAFPAHTVGAIESYPSPATTPAEFRMSGRSCATIVVWTKYRLNRM